MNFCSHCGDAVDLAVPVGDDRARRVCSGCGAIHYENPRVVVGCVIEEGGKLLLCRRAIEPMVGRWTVPAGFLELEESLTQGAARETWEEACARVRVAAPLASFDLLHIGQVYTLFRASLAEPGFAAGPESLEVRLFEPEAIPWDELAFPVIDFALRLYLQDRASGRPNLHLGHLRWNGEGSRFRAANYELGDHRRVGLDPDGT
ncbi:NUDIX hydrolase [Engelhardtia mirabilis]|uniref:Phosphatase NudJ n=1 Tax=Engelhardtia mirabilis TaxID=2528011 RepID=A0A518BHX0_9BACT|nr:Phosphatase NudJ [Planctomycetes bacterium Pla133]QDV00906.1 Phosphatase NudJ [Planctomycetes bacterium Pla86]